MKIIFNTLALLLFIGLTSCDSAIQEKNIASTKSIFDYSGIVEQVIQTSNYTYSYVKVADDIEYWIAVARMDIHAGETIYFNKGMEMIDFHSKELDRTFPSIFFIQMASTDPTGGMAHANMTEGGKPVKQTIEKMEFKIQKAADGITIEELYKDPQKYNGKKVRIRGKITTFSKEILNMNWAHLQDGSEYDGNFDLKVTTAEIVNVDATVTFEGTIELDKDYGYGYYYPVIMQDAVIVHDASNQ